MKLSKIYSNHPDLFKPILFNNSLNVVLGKIQTPLNKKKDTHNLGKSILCQLINFLLAQKKDKRFFLFKNNELFYDFVFFLEIEITDNHFLTIRRSVCNASKLSLKKTNCSDNDFSSLPDTSWDHLNIPTDKARAIIDGILSWEIGDSDFRKVLGYLLRSQSDYEDVFHLSKYKGKNSDWVKYLSFFLGIDSSIVSSIYSIEEELSKLKSQLSLYSDIFVQDNNSGEIEGLISLKNNDILKKQELLDKFDFQKFDLDKTKNEVDNIDSQISLLNNKRYSLLFSLKKINESLSASGVQFDTSSAKTLFDEVGIFFSGQLKKDFDQLIQFNKDITEERNKYLSAEKIKLEKEIKQINDDLKILGKMRSDTLAYLSDDEIFCKYKYLSDELVNLKVELSNLFSQREKINAISNINNEICIKNELKNKKISELKNDISNIVRAGSDSLYSKIRLYFNEIVENVIGKKALLNVEVNKEGHLIFSAKILNNKGESTNEDFGHSYRKLLCVAFDLALLRAHINVSFPRFVYHDGLFESLDDRKKKNLINVLREYTNYGIQVIITMIDSEIPKIEGDTSFINKNEIVLTLHDKDNSGRLFNIPSW